MSQLKARSALLEASGKSAQHETGEVRDLLAAATQELEAVKRSSEALEARLGPLEQECREAQTAQEDLRCTIVVKYVFYGRRWVGSTILFLSVTGKVCDAVSPSTAVAPSFHSLRERWHASVGVFPFVVGCRRLCSVAAIGIDPGLQVAPCPATLGREGGVR